MSEQHDWITLHIVRFKTPVNGVGNPMQGPKGAEIWRFAPAFKLGHSGAECAGAP